MSLSGLTKEVRRSTWYALRIGEFKMSTVPTMATSATMARCRGRTPATVIMPRAANTNTSTVPRSGCNMMRPMGTAAMPKAMRSRRPSRPPARS